MDKGRCRYQSYSIVFLNISLVKTKTLKQKQSTLLENSEANYAELAKYQQQGVRHPFNPFKNTVRLCLHLNATVCVAQQDSMCECE